MSTRDDNDRRMAGERLDASEGTIVGAEVLPPKERVRAVLEGAVREALDAATFDHGADFRPTVALAELTARAARHMDAAGLTAAPVARNPFAERAMPASVEWFATYPPKRRWLLERPGDGDDGAKRAGFLPLGKVGVLAAAGGAGKTMALVQLALSVATGRSWLGDFTVPPESVGHVLLALGEEDAEEVRRRLHNAFAAMWPSSDDRHAAERRRAMELAAERITVLPLAGEPCAFVQTDPRTREVSSTPALAQLRAFLENANHEWSLIALDPLSRFAGAETETDNAAATRFVQSIETLAAMPGSPTVLVAHHTTKASRKGDEATDTTSVRGSSALTDGVRWVATLVPERPSPANAIQGRVFLELTKSNYGPPDKVRSVKRCEGGALVALTSEDRAALEAARVGASAPANGTKPGTKPVTGEGGRNPAW